jgi:hypothetical protein
MYNKKKILQAKINEEGLPFSLFAGIALIGFAIFYVYLTFEGWQEEKQLNSWWEVDCEIISSGVDKEEGYKKKDLFVVQYKYKWRGEVYESNSYRLNYDGDTLIYPEADEISARYKAGDKTFCYVNPDNPKQAVLEQEEPVFLRYMIIPAFIIVLGIRQIYKAYHIFVKGESFIEKDNTELSTYQKATNLFWKWSTRISLIFAFLIGFWLVFFIAVFFIVFPYLFIHAMGDGFQTIKKGLLKTQPVETPTGPDYSKKSRKLRFSRVEKFIIAMAVVIFVIVYSLWVRNIMQQERESGEELFTLFGLLFTAFWTFGLISILTFALIGSIRQFRKDAYKKAQLSEAEKSEQKLKKGQWRYFYRDVTVWSLIVSNLLIIGWALIEKWSVFTVMWVYWIQSVGIGIIWFFKILTLKRFSTKGFMINNKLVQPTRATKIKTSIFFLFHYNFFHIIYALFLSTQGGEVKTGIIILPGLIFLANSFLSFLYNKEKETGQKANIGKLMFYPYFRIIPMHITIIAAGILQDKGMNMEGQATIILFLLLKTVADVVMYINQQRGFADKSKGGQSHLNW